MGSLYLSNLSADQRKELERRLHEAQQGKCFICGKVVDLQLHDGSLHIDHVEPLRLGGKDDPANFALTHASCNESKQASDLRVARVLAKFAEIREAAAQENRGPNLSDVLRHFGGAKYDLALRRSSDIVEMTCPEMGRNEIVTCPVYGDDLSGMDYFFCKIPIEYLHHDDRINPRAVGGSLANLVEEFHKKRPQLHAAVAWAEIGDGAPRSRISVFDGQHKATAQVLLGVRELAVRVFLNPDLEVLRTTNTNAGTTLRQVAFDKSVQRRLGSAIFVDRMDRYRKERGLAFDDESFSEKDLVDHFRGEWREMRRYILDSIRNAITHSSENHLNEFTDFGGKAKERPLSYSALDKTFYSFFIYGDVLDTPLNCRGEEGENPRDLEREQILALMNLVAKIIFQGQFDPMIGTARIENRVQKGDDIADSHLRAYRMAREEILYVWLGFVRRVVEQYFITIGKPVQPKRLFQYRFPEPLWRNIENFLDNLKGLPLWVNQELSLSVFGGKQNYEFWQKVFETGRTPTGQQVLPGGINLIQMIQARPGIAG